MCGRSGGRAFARARERYKESALNPKSFLSPPDTHISFKIVLNYAALVLSMLSSVSPHRWLCNSASLSLPVCVFALGFIRGVMHNIYKHVVLLLSHNRLLYDNVIVFLTANEVFMRHVSTIKIASIPSFTRFWLHFHGRTHCFCSIPFYFAQL